MMGRDRIKAYKEHEAACLTNSSFSSGNGSQGVDPVPIQTMEAGMRLEGGLSSVEEVCARAIGWFRQGSSGAVKARTSWGAPDLVGALTVTMGDGPLDEVSTGATHELLVNAVKAKDAKEKACTQKNRPKL